MKFKPKTEKEIAEGNLWLPGNYAFEILEADDQNDQGGALKDKNGNDMMKLKVKVVKPTGQSQNIFDYVSGEWMEFKLRHLAEATNLLQEYETGELEAYKLVGKTGVCKVGISKDKSGQYPDRNDIKDYIIDDVESVKSTVKDDTIPW